MQLSVLGKGLYYDTDEHCAITYHENSIMVHSEIEGWANKKAIYAEYWIKLTKKWEVQEFEIMASIADKQYKHALSIDKNGHWKCKKNLPHFDFEGITFIDISLTPFTNTLPVNGLHLKKGDSAEFDIIYIDILENRIEKQRQKYTRLTNSHYKFDNMQGFTADIEVDGDGLVIDYPGLFELVRVR